MSDKLQLGAEKFAEVLRRMKELGTGVENMVGATQPTSNGWWPIEAAPQDGTMIDLWVTGGERGPERIADCGWFNGMWRMPCRFCEEYGVKIEAPLRATHWRSIPIGPKRDG